MPSLTFPSSMDALKSESFQLNLEPISVNSMYYGNRLHGKTIKAQDWTHSVFHELSSRQSIESFERLRSFFDPSKHVYSIDLTYRYPAEKLVTKAGHISNKSPDISNVEKPLIDLLFLPKYFDVPSPYGLKNLNVDDRYVVELHSRKIVGELGIDIIVSICELTQITDPQSHT